MSEVIYYPAKILLLGEYAAILGAESVAIPWLYHNGYWVKEKSNSDLHQKLMKYKEYFEEMEKSYILYDSMEDDIENGYYFHSDITNGYGIGSSGALVAAVYEKYGIDEDANLQELKDIFVDMESYFHGTSSGIDPLVSYLKRGIIIQKGNVQIFDYEDISILDNIYLWDTKLSRKTKPLVEWFHQQLTDESFSKLVHNEFLTYNSEALEALIADDKIAWKKAIQKISQFERKHFIPMVPPVVQKEWDAITEMNDTEIKLCGAGGGGFYLIYCENEETVEKLSSQLNGELIPFYNKDLE